MRVLHAYGNDPSEIPGHQGLDELPTLIPLCMCCHTSLVEELFIHVTNERRHFEAYTWLLLDFIQCTIPFANFDLYPFTIMNCNTNIRDFRSPLSPFSELSGLRVVKRKHKTPANKVVIRIK